MTREEAARRHAIEAARKYAMENGFIHLAHVDVEEIFLAGCSHGAAEENAACAEIAHMHARRFEAGQGKWTAQEIAEAIRARQEGNDVQA